MHYWTHYSIRYCRVSITIFVSEKNDHFPSRFKLSVYKLGMEHVLRIFNLNRCTFGDARNSKVFGNWQEISSWSYSLHCRVIIFHRLGHWPFKKFHSLELQNQSRQLISLGILTGKAKSCILSEAYMRAHDDAKYHLSKYHLS